MHDSQQYFINNLIRHLSDCSMYMTSVTESSCRLLDNNDFSFDQWEIKKNVYKTLNRHPINYSWIVK